MPAPARSHSKSHRRPLCTLGLALAALLPLQALASEPQPAAPQAPSVAARRPDLFAPPPPQEHGSVFLLVDGNTAVAGDFHDMKRMRSLAAGGKLALLYMKPGGERHVLRDRATIEAVAELFRQQQELAEREATLSQQQSSLEEQQSTLEIRQAANKASRQEQGQQQVQELQALRQKRQSLAQEREDLSQRQQRLAEEIRTMVDALVRTSMEEGRR